MALCALSYANDGGAARICQRGAKARERSDRAGDIFSKFVYETGIFCTFIIRGSLCILA